MSDRSDQLSAFAAYVRLLSGDEKGEAQVFCDRLFQAFGHDGYKEAGAVLEYRIRKGPSRRTSFADLVWKPRLLLEMKRRGENLGLHYKQAFDYWLHSVPNRPRYVVLCNFDEFWVYDFDRQLDDPVDRLGIEDLVRRHTVLNFLLPDNPEPVFGNDKEAVSREAADKVAVLFNALVSRDVPRTTAQRFILQLVVTMFSEDIDLMPQDTVYGIARDCLERGQSSFDLFGGLFRQMNSPRAATGGRYQGVPYFNGGLFEVCEPVELDEAELELIAGDDGACTRDWARVNPAVFGTLFQQSMGEEERHAHGAHFTAESDIQRIVGPTIVSPWMSRIESATRLTEFLSLRNALAKYKVLDPACGSGNFLYVSYREISRIETAILKRMTDRFAASTLRKHVKSITSVRPQQFFGIDTDPFAVELAKVTLLLAKKLAMDEASAMLGPTQTELGLHEDEALPLENLDANFLCEDALFIEWPTVDAIIGNPPFQSKNKMQVEFGRAYVNKVRSAYPDVPGRADYCVYWFRKAHDNLRTGQRAGLVGTNTISQTYSRVGGLDYIVGHGGTITDAVSTQVWPGEAVVHVSIVNWIKGEYSGPRRLYRQLGDSRDSDWQWKEMPEIGPSLSFETDVSSAGRLGANFEPKVAFQGQTHGHAGFLLSMEEAERRIGEEPEVSRYLHPYLTADDLLGENRGIPQRMVIDFGEDSHLVVRETGSLFQVVEDNVLPDRIAAAEREERRNEAALQEDSRARTTSDHSNALKTWWQLYRRRGELLERISSLPRYIACGRVTKRPIFEFICTSIRPNDALAVFALADDYSFGILQSSLHWAWFKARCSTLKSDPRYTSSTVFDSYPWPQSVSRARALAVARAARQLRRTRRSLQEDHDLSLRDLYRTMETPGDHPLRAAHSILDQEVERAYGLKGTTDALGFLLELNRQLQRDEESGNTIVGPGLPEWIDDGGEYFSDDCLGLEHS